MTPIEVKTASTAELVELYNKLTGKAIKKFENRRIAEARTQEAVDNAAPGQLKAAEGIIQPDPALKEAAAPTDKERGASKTTSSATRKTAAGPVRTGLPGPNSKLTGKKIYRKVAANPRREGTAGHASFAIIRDGMSYEEYRLAGGRSNDLAWDIAHDFVEVK